MGYYTTDTFFFASLHNGLFLLSARFGYFSFKWEDCHKEADRRIKRWSNLQRYSRQCNNHLSIHFSIYIGSILAEFEHYYWVSIEKLKWTPRPILSVSLKGKKGRIAGEKNQIKKNRAKTKLEK